MSLSQFKLRIKNVIKSTRFGKFLRDQHQMIELSRKNAEMVFSTYSNTDNGIKHLDREKTIEDMMVEARKYSFGFEEYFMFHFYEKSHEERRQYVSCRERISYCERMNSMENMIYFDDKSLSYELFGAYYKRDLIGIFNLNDNNVKNFAEFVSKHNKYIVKPFDGAGGYGIKIVESKGKLPGEQIEELLKCYPKGFVAEELIEQSQELSLLHPESVNTIRIPTILYKDRVDIIHPVLRVGRGGNIVDNSHSGGISCGVDVVSGKIISAADAMGKKYVKHPDTGINLIGYIIPDWEQAKDIAMELAKVLPNNRYTGWDLAHTKNGWIMQEGNDRGDFDIFQLTSNTGFRPEIEKIVKELGV